jgi:hypothetical protein
METIPPMRELSIDYGIDGEILELMGSWVQADAGSEAVRHQCGEGLLDFLDDSVGEEIFLG